MSWVIVVIVCALFAAFILFTARRLIRKRERRQSRRQKSAEYAGKKGEYAVRDALGQNISQERYVFYDYILDWGRHTTEIDVIFINKAGVFVIEAKNWAGEVKGDLYGDEWTQWTSAGKAKHYNPFLQNETHVQALKSILPSKTPIYPMVVFVKDNVTGPAAPYVHNIDSMLREINSKEKILSGRYIGRLAKILYSHKSSSSKEEHIENVREMHG